MIEWPEDEVEPTKYWLSNLGPETSTEDLVEQAKLRWRIERDYQELKRELGLGHYEGRGWRGFHHQASLCIAAYGFLVSLRATIPPSAPPQAQIRQIAGLSAEYRPRGSANTTRAARANLDHHAPKTAHRRPGLQASPMSLLQSGRQSSVYERGAEHH